MSGWKKLASAAAASGGGLNVEDVFSSYVYFYESNPQTINNGLDLAGEGGLIITKNRVNSTDWKWVDTERSSLSKALTSADNNTEDTDTGGIASVTSTGYTLGTNSNYNSTNTANRYVSYTFRKAPKFFDVVTYTGDGTSGRSISHNLGCDVGIIIIKNLTRSSDWHVWHRGFTSISYGAALNQTYSEFTNGGILTATPTSTTVTIKNPGYDGAGTNNNGDSYVMYLFAHNDGDGEFGPTGDQDIIKCGSYQGNDSNQSINLGWEPQWILIKRVDSSGDWRIVDNMSGGLTARDLDEPSLMPHFNNGNLSFQHMTPTATGFDLTSSDGTINNPNGTYAYVAIRNSPMSVPTSSSEFFDVQKRGSIDPTIPPWMKSQYDWRVDLGISRGTTNSSNNFEIHQRQTEDYTLETNTSDRNRSQSSQFTWDYQGGFGYNLTPNTERADSIEYFWKRAPSVHDSFNYYGTGQNRTVPHSLGVEPEMIWVKHHSQNWPWRVYHKDLGATKYLQLDSNAAAVTSSLAWNNTAPTASVFSLSSYGYVNQSGALHLAALFATASGVSKVGSYTGNATSNTTIDCGFSNGAKFVLIKNATTAGYGWYVYDTKRGLDYQMQLDSADETNTQTSAISSHSSGFTLSSSAFVNRNNDTYIFYAIATP